MRPGALLHVTVGLAQAASKLCPRAPGKAHPGALLALKTLTGSQPPRAGLAAKGRPGSVVPAEA